MKEKEGVVEPFDHNEFSEYAPRTSSVTRNKNKKTVSVSNAFDGNRIPIKIIASYEQWVRLEEKFLKNNEIDFKDLKPYISRASKQTIRALKNYCNEESEDFYLHSYYYYIRPSKKKNPLCTCKPRRLLHDDKILEKKFEIRYIAGNLYLFFSHWFKHKPKDCPKAVKDFFKKYDICHDKELSNPWEQAVSATMEVVREYFKFDINKIVDPKTFYDKYIARKHLTSIRRGLDLVGYLPDRLPKMPPKYELPRHPLKDLA